MKPVILAAVPDRADQPVPREVDAATEAEALHATASTELDEREARRRVQAFAASRRLAAATSLAGAELAATTAIHDLVGADRSHCLFFEAASGDLWSADDRSADGGREHAADRGMAGWAARTGCPARCARAGADPDWVAAVDDPQGRGDERLLVQPVTGSDDAVHAVLIAVRGAQRPEFGDEEAIALHAFATLAGPLLEQLAWSVEASSRLEEARDGMLFRAEAVDAQGERRWGDVVRVAPPWIRWAYRGLALMGLAVGVLAVVGRVHTYARGPALVRMRDRVEVTARTAGNIAAVTAVAGARVEAGDVLARLDDEAQAAQTAQLERELEARLRERLLAPSDPSTGEAVSRVRLELERARAALDERLVRAPVDGVIGAVRVRPGQRVEPGAMVSSIVDAAGALEVIAFLPGGERPRIQPGQRMRFALSGYRDVHQDLAVHSVAAEAMGPEEARDYLGRVADGVDLRGPMVLVRAVLGAEFVADGVAYHYIDGMSGSVEVEVATESLLDVLLPGLEEL
jgi:multidrug efflux pump subunit AcrA (membrane-fusion protein)